MPTGRGEPFWESRAYLAAVWLAGLWALGNCVYVYGVMHGERTYRIETAAFLLVLVLLPRVAGRRATGLAHGEPSRAWRRGVAGGALLVWALVVLPFVGLPFLSDDYVFLDRYRSVGDVLHQTAFFRPAFAALFLILHRLGDGPAVFHGVSFALHLASAALVYSLARRLFDGTGPALVAFVVFLLNPLQLEATLWVSGLQELLWSVCVLAAMRAHIGSDIRHRWRLALTTGFVACALLAKETAVCAVVLLPLADVAVPDAARRRQAFRTYAIVATLLVAYFVIRQGMVGFESGYLVRPSPYFLKELVGRPYAAFVQPWNMAAIAVPSAVLGLAAAAALALLFGAVVFGRPSRRVLIGPVVVLASTLPVYSYLFVGADLAGSRYLYFASAGWGLLLAALVATLRPSRAVLVIALAIVIAGSSISLELNTRPWRAAGDLVRVLTSTVRRGESVEAAAAAWHATHPGDLVMRGGVPASYDGVGILLNGFPEFARGVRER